MMMKNFILVSKKKKKKIVALIIKIFSLFPRSFIFLFEILFIYLIFNNNKIALIFEIILKEENEETKKKQ
jgi:hypothetical protein